MANFLQVHCAVSTRESSGEGLEQSFNSLDGCGSVRTGTFLKASPLALRQPVARSSTCTVSLNIRKNKGRAPEGQDLNLLVKILREARPHPYPLLFLFLEALSTLLLSCCNLRSEVIPLCRTVYGIDTENKEPFLRLLC